MFLMTDAGAKISNESRRSHRSKENQTQNRSKNEMTHINWP